MTVDACSTWVQIPPFLHHIYLRDSRVCLCVAVVAADGGDELLHAVLGAAVAGGARLVQ